MWDTIQRIDDAEQNVAKFVYKSDTAVAESVLYKYPTYQERTVICCSTQSGCPVGCRFCGAGNYFVRNLTADEIVNQVDYSIEQSGVAATDMKRLQIMFMSMGEPMLNLKALLPAIRQLNHKYPNAKLLISTSGPDVDYMPLHLLAKEIDAIGLQFSVHESTDEARDKLVPFKKKLTLDGMRQEGNAFHDLTGRQAFFNYCAHDGNSSIEDAERIRALYHPRDFCATVSVICEQNDGLPATNDHQRQLAIDFAEKLVALGYDTRVFDPAGQDTIGGGCGQLWFVQDWMEKHPDKAKPSVGHGLPKVHVPGNELEAV